MVKIIGVEWNRFYADESAWPEGAWYDDAEITIDGQLVDDDFDLSEVPDSAIMTVSGGLVFLDGSVNNAMNYQRQIVLETHLRRWKKRQTTTVILFEVHKSDVDAIKSAIANAGGKVIAS